MLKALRTLGLWLLLVVAQQGAVVHVLSHFAPAGQVGVGLRIDSQPTSDTTCAQCPAFAQVVSPAFSHSFQIPVHVLIAIQRSSELRILAIAADVPHPRSRGPPSLS